MLGDTITITINSVAKVLSKINQDSYGSEYYLKEADRNFNLKVRHSKDRVGSAAKPRDRHQITLVETIFATPTAAAIVRQTGMTLVGDFDDSSVNQARNTLGLVGYLTQANTEKLLNWES